MTETEKRLALARDEFTALCQAAPRIIGEAGTTLVLSYSGRYKRLCASVRYAIVRIDYLNSGNQDSTINERSILSRDLAADREKLINLQEYLAHRLGYAPNWDALKTTQAEYVDAHM